PVRKIRVAGEGGLGGLEGGLAQLLALLVNPQPVGLAAAHVASKSSRAIRSSVVGPTTRSVTGLSGITLAYGMARSPSTTVTWRGAEIGARVTNVSWPRAGAARCSRTSSAGTPSTESARWCAPGPTSKLMRRLLPTVWAPVGSCAKSD